MGSAVSEMMIATTIALLATLSRRDPLVAFIARIYYPPGDGRRSRYQVYVSNLHGKGRRQLTRGSAEPVWVKWIGRDAIAWSQVGGSMFVSRVRPFAPRRILVPSNLEEIDSPRGVALLASNSEIRSETPQGMSYPVPKHVFRMTPGGLVAAPPSNARLSEHSWDRDTAKFQIDGHWVETYWEKPTLRIDGREYAFQPASDWPPVPAAVKDGEALIVTRTDAGSHGMDRAVYRLRLSDGAVEALVAPLGGLDFDPVTEFYAGLSFGGRGIVPYGKHRQVWAAKLYAGSWRTGKRWLVLGGIVHVTSAALQP